MFTVIPAGQFGTVLAPAVVRARLARELARYGITEARLRRRCWRGDRIPARTVAARLNGDPGEHGQWTGGLLYDWVELIRTAWLF